MPKTKKKTEILKYNVVLRKPGFIYFIDKDGNLCCSPMVKGSQPGRKYRKKIPVTSRQFSRV